jgi:DMSO/TMAO reductase YedYZ molybdopterin-dependent catalytic subunit
LKSGGAFARLTLLQETVPSPAFGQAGEEVLPWESLVDSWLTPSDRFSNVHHYDQPENLDEATWRVSITGPVARPQSLTIADLKAHERPEVDFTQELVPKPELDTTRKRFTEAFQTKQVASK